ncbi:peroxisomal 2,4-dienoyl-CoA reductase [(3E)-enoyl-CoA-producing] isoform X1 [Pongo abelii]|uniref:peroxisomal 2,4-dienoyl-CoA reductase [(3E)-enoyl-CoA-producing] isoform X1 n=2 Tax=Pongo abelii TaxID=9601 RepID=UPI0023E89F5A|nr:peroxisomal 2,4-dienoyl-CoA reductase [(3E)-enoyl-CoA-producing] isoform X1 [Pongo abelii]
MAQPPPDVEGDDCLPAYRHLFCPDLLRDKVAFITGGGSGIGFRIAEIFMRHGCHTVIASRSLPRVLTAEAAGLLSASLPGFQAARKLAGATGRRCLPLSMDVRAPPAIVAAVDQALKEFGRIDILINCSSSSCGLPFCRCSRELPVPRRRLVLQRLQDRDGHRHQRHLQRVSCALREVLPGPRRGDCEHHCHPGEPGAGTAGARRLRQGRCGRDDTALGCGVGSPKHPRQQPRPWPHQWHGGAPATGWPSGQPEHQGHCQPAAEAGEQDRDCPQRALPGQPSGFLRDGGRAGGRWRGMVDVPKRCQRAGGFRILLC